MKRLVLTAAAVLLLCAAIMAAPQSGRVVNRDGQPIRDVSVLTDNSRIGTTTDSLGQFTIDLTDDITLVTFSSVGYQSVQFRVDAVPDVIVLERRYFRGEDITVTADRAEKGVTPVSFENVSREEIDRDYTVGDLPMLLNNTPNFYSFADGGGKMGYTYTRIRGFDDKRISAYINGVPLNDPEDQYLYWVDLPDFVSSVSDVQIQRGVGNSLYGDASFGGSINVVTNTLAQPQRVGLSTGFGQYLDGGTSLGQYTRQTVDYASGLINGRWAFNARFSKQKSDGYREDSWVDAWSYFISAARLDPKMTTEVNVFGGPTSLRLTFLGITRDQIEANRRMNPLTYDNETDNFTQPHYHIHNTYRLNDHTTLRNSLYYIKGDGYFEQLVNGASFSEYNIDTSATGGAQSGDLVRKQTVSKYQLGWNPRLDLDHAHGRHSIGGSFYYFESDHFGEVVWAQNLVQLLDPRHKYYQYYGQKRVGSVYGQEYYRLTDRLAVQATAQLRYEDYNFQQDRLGAFQGFQYGLDWLFFSPRLGFNYELIDDGPRRASLYTNFGVASRAPSDAAVYDASDPNVFPSLEIRDTTLSSSGNLVYDFGDPTFDAERVYNIEFGGTWRTPRYSFGANLYWMDFSDEIISYGGVNTSTGQITTVNAEGSWRAGIELSGAWRAMTDFTLSGNLSLNRYRIKDFTDTLDVYYLDYPSNPDTVGQVTVTFDDAHGLAFPDLLGNLIATYRPGSFRFTYRLQGVGRQYMELVNIDDLAIDGYTVSSLTAGYTVPNLLNVGRMTVTATVDNLFDTKYETSGYGWNYGLADSPGEPVTLTGGAEYYVAAERSYYIEMQWAFF